ncbi:DUF3152 domain-containing protein [Streptomyces sp. NPDC050504]|uniref:DUF3152 domain-containing protein n=1 Tax=Streptomyces sp. NPDC050504 TaxID=3365618 RepID=UPI0037A215B0
MGRHSRKSPAPQGADQGVRPGGSGAQGGGTHGEPTAAVSVAPGSGRRRRGAPPAPRVSDVPVSHEPFSGSGADVRGGHPEGTAPEAPAPERYAPWQGGSRAPRPAASGAARIPGPRTAPAAQATAPPGSSGPSGSSAGAAPAPRDPYASVTEWDAEAEFDGPTAPGRRKAARRGGRGRLYVGVAAAVVTAVLAAVVAGQVEDGGDGKAGAAAAGPVDRDTIGTSRHQERPAPAAPPVRTPVLTYEQKMERPYPLAARLTGSGKFQTVPGADKAPGAGEKYRYRVDIEKGLALDAALFAEAVQKTLNDPRSWAHGGKVTFERISKGEPDFVITLASPGTTGVWCAKSDLDTVQMNVSCDSAATPRVMINAYRWAQGAEPYGLGKQMFVYRQMLINHEVGHRLGRDHEGCPKSGALAPVMMQQTKTLETDGAKCRPNAWPFPGN